MKRNLFLIAAALFLWGFGEGIFFNFVPIYLSNRFKLSEQQIGLALGAMGFFMLLMHLPGGYLADKIGRRPLLIAAWLMGLLATALMALAQRLPLYLAGFFAYGLTAFVSSPLSSYVTAGRGELSVGAALARVSAAFNIGMALGPVTGGWLGERYGMQSGYFAAAGVFALSTLLLSFIQPQPLDRHEEGAPPLSLWRNRRFIVFLALTTFAVFAMYLAQPLTPNFLESVRRLPLSDTGIVFSMGALGNALLTFAFSRVHPRRGFIFGQALVALFALLMLKGSGLPVFMLGYFLLGGFRAFRPMAQAQARELAHVSQMGLTYGALETAYAVIFVLVPPLAGFLFERDPFLIYRLAAAFLLVSIGASALYMRRTAHA